MRKLFALLLLCSMTLSAGMQYSNPKPSFDTPRKIFMKLNMSDVHEVNHMLGTIYNLLKDYPSDALKVEVIVYGPGMRAIRKDYDSKTLSRIRSLMAYEVDFVGCRNTMQTMKWTEKDFIDNITYVQAGIAQVIERQVGGWVDATPY